MLKLLSINSNIMLYLVKVIEMDDSISQSFQEIDIRIVSP